MDAIVTLPGQISIYDVLPSRGKYGFTGTRRGMTEPQRRQFQIYMEVIHTDVVEFHHGVCIGADAEAYEIVCGLPKQPRVVWHPPLDVSKMTAVLPREGDEVREPFDYLVRNKHIVNETDVLIACPRGREEKRSGTWSTVRYARSLARPLVIIYPDGVLGYS